MSKVNSLSQDEAEDRMDTLESYKAKFKDTLRTTIMQGASASPELLNKGAMNDALALVPDIIDALFFGTDIQR